MIRRTRTTATPRPALQRCQIMEPLFRRLDPAVNVGEGLLQAQSLCLEGALELTGLDGLALTELAEEVTLEMRDLAHELDEAEVDILGRDGSGGRG